MRYIHIACWIMVAGAALEIVAAVIGVVTENGTRAALAAGTSPRPDAGLLQSLVSAHGETIVTSSVAAAAVWLIMAYANRQAGTTARYISVFLFLCCSSDTLDAFNEPNSEPTRVINVIIWLAGLAAVMLVFSDKLVRRARYVHDDAIIGN